MSTETTTQGTRFYRVEAVADGRLLGISEGEGQTPGAALGQVARRRGAKRADWEALERAYAAVGEASGYRVVEMSEPAWLVLAEDVVSRPAPAWPTDAGMSPSDAEAL